MGATAKLEGALAMLGALALVAGGCGLGPRHVLNNASIERQVSGQLAARYSVGKPRVTCPGRIPAQVGVTFSCTAYLDGQAARLKGMVTSTSGGYQVQPLEAIVVSAQAAGRLAASLSSEEHRAVSVDCAGPALRVVPPGGRFICRATLAGNGSSPVTVTVLDAAGHVRYSFRPPS